MAAAVKGAVEAGDCALSSDVVHAALRDWALKADIETGLADVAAGRIRDFDVEGIVERGRRSPADRSSA